MSKQAYLPDLADYHACCEINYARLTMYLRGNFAQGHEILLQLQDNSRLSIKIEEHYRYTSLMRAELSPDTVYPWSCVQQFQLSACHDLSLLEVTAFDKKQYLKGKYQYPNEQMLLPDEKSQVNKHFGELLQRVEEIKSKL